MVEVHDLHVWEVTTGMPAISAHLIVGRDADCHEARWRAARLLADALRGRALHPPGRARAGDELLQIERGLAANVAAERPIRPVTTRTPVAISRTKAPAA